jgi:AraC family transcriptional regulator of adaptative response/methylated-DNA-[protein]-cysteine methyltransferase
MLETISQDRWKAVCERDASFDGKFFFAVSTTGVYCRPSCASRAPRAEHVRFFDSAEEAERAGFRACLRCRPGEPTLRETYAKMIADACRFIEEQETEPTLAQLANRAEMSPAHFHRIFKTVIGLTPKQFAAAHRSRLVREGLRSSATVTEAIYEAGYNSSSRFYEKSGELLGMTPGNFRDGGRNIAIRYALSESALGQVLVAQSERGICAILLGDDPGRLVEELRQKFPHAALAEAGDDFQKVVAEVVRLVEHPERGLSLPLDLHGTAFQQRVWLALREIPAGATCSYAEVARRIGQPKAVRAVAGACAANSLAVAIPCHRVIASDRKLAGYRWGVERKRALLAREAQA